VRVATWNINNVTKRLDLLLDWLDRTKPDVVALQELKTTTAAFPARALQDAGYESLVIGQRAWNGVALLGRGHDPLPVLTSLPGDDKDKEARYVEAADQRRAVCLSVPAQRQPATRARSSTTSCAGSSGCSQRAEALWTSGQPVVLLGDWNVVPTDADIYKPETWRNNALLATGGSRGVRQRAGSGLDRCAASDSPDGHTVHLLGLPPRPLGSATPACASITSCSVPLSPWWTPAWIATSVAATTPATMRPSGPNSSRPKPKALESRRRRRALPLSPHRSGPSQRHPNHPAASRCPATTPSATSARRQSPRAGSVGTKRKAKGGAPLAVRHPESTGHPASTTTSGWSWTA
jgi:exodeoxyribonuclease III